MLRPLKVELNTLLRTTIWSEGAVVSSEAELLEDVTRHYPGRAMDDTHRNNTRAEDLGGLPSYQTLTPTLAREVRGADLIARTATRAPAWSARRSRT